MDQLNQQLNTAKEEILYFSQNNKELKFSVQLCQEIILLINKTASSEEKNCVNLFDSISWLPSGSDFLNAHISPSLKKIRDGLNQEKVQERVKKHANKTHPLIYLIIVLELLGLPIWWLYVVLSIGGDGTNWQYWLVVGPTWSYPLLVIICAIWSITIKNDVEYIKSFFIVLLPPIIAVGWPMFIYTLSVVKLLK